MVYNKFKYEKTFEYHTALMKLGAQLTREVTSRKIKEIDIIFPEKFENS